MTNLLIFHKKLLVLSLEGVANACHPVGRGIIPHFGKDLSFPVDAIAHAAGRLPNGNQLAHLLWSGLKFRTIFNIYIKHNSDWCFFQQR